MQWCVLVLSFFIFVAYSSPPNIVFLVLQKPDLVIFVIDGSVGKDAFEQARAFRESFAAGVAIVTKINTYPKSFGALAA